jgi:hypothetical protein
LGEAGVGKLALNLSGYILDAAVGEVLANPEKAR